MNNFITPDFTKVLRSMPSGTPKVMLSVDRDGSQTIVRINSSSLSLLQTCARKSFYTLRQGWRSRNGSPPLIYGSAIHKGLEIFYNQPRSDRFVPDGFEDIALSMAHGSGAPDKHFLYDAITAFIKEAEPLKSLPDTDKRSLSSGVWVLGHYFRTYINDVYEIYRDDEGPVTERTFEVVLFEKPDLKVIVFGTIDFILRNMVTGSILPGDHKTASQMGNDFLSRIKPNHQYTGYLFGANKVMGLETEDFLVNGIQVKSRPLTARGGPPTFTRQITKRTEADFEEFKDVIEWAVRSYLKWDEMNVWPLGNVDSCSMFGGCGYLDVCSAPNSLRQNILESKYARQS